MRVERWIAGDALDLTWAYFWQVHGDIDRAVRVESGRGYTVEEANALNIADQKRRKDREI